MEGGKGEVNRPGDLSAKADCEEKKKQMKNEQIVLFFLRRLYLRQNQVNTFPRCKIRDAFKSFRHLSASKACHF